MHDPFSDINKHGVIAIPALLWAIILFEARGWILAFFGFVSAVIGSREASGLISGDSWQPILIAELLALLVLWAALRRTPDGGELPRWLWRHGQAFICLAAASHVAWALLRHAQAAAWMAWHDDQRLLLSIADALIALGIWLSAHARAVFQEFPPPPPAKAP
ncbi:MAG: DUF2919 family protein [Rhodocyclaceae bacterium]|jgi:hypothetical protein|nr:DUF2919 family protein [Rhodocyclaceae bacterium]